MDAPNVGRAGGVVVAMLTENLGGRPLESIRLLYSDWDLLTTQEQQACIFILVGWTSGLLIRLQGKEELDIAGFLRTAGVRFAER